MIKELLKGLIVRLSELDELRYVGIDCGQLDGDRTGVKWPCCLLSVEQMESSPLLRGGELLRGELRLVYAFVYNVPASLSSNVDVDSLRYLGVVDAIHDKLMYWRDVEGIGYLTRERMNRTSDLFVGCERWEIVYRFSVEVHHV